MADKLKIALDAGHGLKTAGKQTPDGIKEWTLNDKVRDKIVDILKDYDVEIIHTDNDEGNIDESLSSRVAKYKSAGVSAFVSIHHNAYTGSWNGATGVEVYTDKKPTSQDTQLANLIYYKLVKYTGLRGRGVKKAAYTVINQNTIPAVLVEGGFMDSTNDYKYITSDAGQTAYAKAVAEGLVEFLGLTKKAVVTPVVPVIKPITTTTARNYLMKGDKGAEVKTMQENLIYMGYSCGSAGADGDFGSGTDSAVKAFQKANGLTVDGKYGIKSKAKLEELVTNKKKATAKPAPTYTRTQFIKDVQKAIGVTVDGIVGNKTLGALITVSKSKNRKHAVVKPLQKYLNALGYNCGAVDGIAGSKFDSAAKAWAKANGCVADGEFTKGGKSWKRILGVL